MFETVNSAEVIMPPELGLLDEKVWWYTKLRLHTHWFYVVCEYLDITGDKYSEMYLISQHYQLRDLQESHDHTIRQMYIVTPGYMNGSNKWKMEEMSEILVGIEPENINDQEAYIYVLGNGDRYVDSLLSTGENDLLYIKRFIAL